MENLQIHFFLLAEIAASNCPEDRLEELIDASNQVKEKAYSPYSDFPVGAAALGIDGRIYTGELHFHSEEPFLLNVPSDCMGGPFGRARENGIFHINVCCCAKEDMFKFAIMHAKPEQNLSWIEHTFHCIRLTLRHIHAVPGIWAMQLPLSCWIPVQLFIKCSAFWRLQCGVCSLSLDDVCRKECHHKGSVWGLSEIHCYGHFQVRSGCILLT